MTERTLRVDAERNRRSILDAAAMVFAEQGIEAPLNEIARRAGVGIATLFRRFPTREELVAATFAEGMSANAAAAERALADPDPWRAFCRYIEDVCAMQAGNRGFTDVLTQSFPGARGLEAERARSFAAFRELVRRAQAAGVLRSDFTHEDFALLLMANAGVVSAMGDAAPDAWRRLVAYLLAAFAASAVVPDGPLPPSPTPRQVTRALARARRSASATGSEPT